MYFNIDEMFRNTKTGVFAVGFSYFRNSADADDVVQKLYKLFKSGKILKARITHEIRS